MLAMVSEQQISQGNEAKKKKQNACALAIFQKIKKIAGENTKVTLHDCRTMYTPELVASITLATWPRMLADSCVMASRQPRSY